MTPRPARPADLDGLRPGWEALVAWGRARDPRFVLGSGAWPERRRQLAHGGLSGPWPHAWVIDDGAQIQAFLLGAAAGPTWLVSPPTAVIHDLWVAEAHRRRGLGRALVDAWREAAARGGAGAFEVDTLTLDVDALAFWRAAGFGPWRTTLRA